MMRDNSAKLDIEILDWHPHHFTPTQPRPNVWWVGVSGVRHSGQVGHGLIEAWGKHICMGSRRRRRAGLLRQSDLDRRL